MALINIPPELHVVDPLDAHLLQGDGRSVYRLKHAEKSPGRLANEFWASHILLLFKHPDFDSTQLREWRQAPCANGHKTNSKKLDELRLKHPDLAEPIDAAIDNIRSVDR